MSDLLTHRPCAQCGKQFKAGSRKHRFCSKECRAADYKVSRRVQPRFRVLPCEECGKEFETSRTNARFCHRRCRDKHAWKIAAAARRASAPPWGTEHQKTCEHCNKAFATIYAWQKHCSKECNLAAAKAKANAAYAPKPRKTCEHCNKTFAAIYAWQKRCSKECTLAAARLQTRAKANAAYAAKPRRQIRLACAFCSRPFVVQALTDTRRIYCSPECYKRNSLINTRAKAKASRRARIRAQRTGNIYFAEVATRDGHNCQICGGPVDYDAAPNTPNYPSLDHIVPLSKGGAHGMENVQLAHFGCNSRKRDKPLTAENLARLMASGG